MKLIAFAKILLLLAFSTLSFSVLADDSNDNNTNTENSSSQVNPYDANLMKQIKTRIKKNPIFSNMNIEINISNGVVILDGAVARRPQLYEIVNLIRSVPGVRDIVSNLRVDPNAANRANTQNNQENQSTPDTQ